MPNADFPPRAGFYVRVRISRGAWRCTEHVLGWDAPARVPVLFKLPFHVRNNTVPIVPVTPLDTQLLRQLPLPADQMFVLEYEQERSCALKVD